KTAVVVPAPVKAGRDALQRGDVDEASRTANQLLAENTHDLHALRLLLDIELEKQNGGRADMLATRLLESYGAAGDRIAASALIAEFRSHRTMHQFLARAAALLERWGDRESAIDLLEQVAEAESGTPNALTALLRLANLRRSAGDRAGAMEALQRALVQPACSPEWRRRIDSAIASL
ncbi:MAG TPA: tetratricopeptide repeat protein, partial [Thermoanaerobaculia bacterium]|nr:tetratricopeptide repeat protein [Thermoanaerobaculia bacterium]